MSKMSVGLHKCAGVYKCQLLCAAMPGCKQVSICDEFSEYLLETRFLTSANYSTHPLRIFFMLSLYHFKSDFWPISLYISPPNFAYPFLTDICSLGLRESQKAYTFWSPGGAKVFIISISFLESRKPSFPPCSEI